MAISVRHNSLLLNNKGVKNVNDPAEDFNIPFRRLIRSVNSSELLFFTSQLSLMLEIDTPLNLALTALREQTENRNFKKIFLSKKKFDLSVCYNSIFIHQP